jgi:DNA polymerase-3 subunit gamma/tau
VEGPTPTPCDHCDVCKAVATGEDIDVLEIDGASNRGIDNIREIRQNVGTRPTRSRYKIYIIDEVHMLSKDAFNALLKTLEEPPSHVKFIFATTEVQKIPITILSRCQRFDFAGIHSNRIADRLKQVVAEEGMRADEDALRLIARRAGGSMRDAQSLLDQLLAFAGDHLTLDRVHQLLGTAGDEHIDELVQAIIARNVADALNQLDRFAKAGLQFGEILDQLIDYWRGLMLLHAAGKEHADVQLMESQLERAWQHAQSLNLDSILAGLDLLATTKGRLRNTNHGFILLEMAVLRLIRLDELVSLAELSQRLFQSGSIPNAGNVVNANSSEDASKKNGRIRTESPQSDSTPAKKSEIGSKPRTVEEIWSLLLEAVGPILSGNLSAGKMPAIIGPNTLVLSFPLGYTSHQDYCALPTSVENVQRELERITGEAWTFRVEATSSTQDISVSERIEIDESKADMRRVSEKMVKEMPLIAAAIDRLGARLLKFDEGFASTTASETQTDPKEGQEN